MKTVLLIIGVLALLMGLLWIGQGFGLVMWPSSSFMLEQKIWALWGSLLALIGVLLIWHVRRS
jgi:hypothetical protein